MKQAKNDLKSALQQEGQPPISDTPESVAPAPGQHAQRRPSRQGKKLISGHFDKAVHYQLKVICLETGSTIQGLLAESLNLLFEKHDKEPIA